MELNRFKQLLESTMGDAKPLIMEQTTASYTTQKFNQFYYKNASGHQTMGFKPGVKFEATKDSKIVTAKNVDVLNFWNNKWESKGKKRVSFYCEQGKFYFEGDNLGYVDESKQLAPNLVKNVCGRTAVVTPSVVTPPSDHVCDTDTTSKLHQGMSYKYCKNGEKYYFIGTAGEFKTKHPNWTEATGKGLESIKTMIGPVFDKM
jgi:hypothetical protein